MAVLYSILCALVVLQVVSSFEMLEFNPQVHWENFKNAFQKNYTDEEEESSKMEIFVNHIQNIFHHNLDYDLGLKTFRKGLNAFSDVSHEDFLKQMTGFKAPKSLKPVTTRPMKDDLPTEVDWRNQGLITPVKDQGKCGACWAFSATGSMEAQTKKKTGHLVSLSEQNLVDCSKPFGNNGCEGGLMDNAFSYIKSNEGIETESSYPYTAEDGGTCHFKKEDSAATCTGFVDIPSGDENALKEAVAKVGPVSVGIDGGQESFQMYKGGVYDEESCSSTELNHAVLVIGYGTEDGKDYWLAKNSWGTSWGESGYIKMSRNKNNQCGIATTASYPLFGNSQLTSNRQPNSNSQLTSNNQPFSNGQNQLPINILKFFQNIMY